MRLVPCACACACALSDGANLCHSFVVNPRLVRGLDYYGQTVFEFVGQPGPQLGPQQATLLAGGVYDSLVSTFGGPAISGVG
jgi:histidyl-tRNA synthetase